MRPLADWTAKDYANAGVTAALCIAIGILVKGLAGIVLSKIPAASSLLVGVGQAVIIALSLMRLTKAGFLTVLGVTMGAFYGFVFPGHPFMFGAFTLAGCAGDATAAVLRNHGRRLAIFSGVLVFRVGVILLGAVFAWWMGFSKADLAWAMILIDCAGTVVGVVIGLFAALRLSRELERAGLIVLT